MTDTKQEPSQHSDPKNRSSEDNAQSDQSTQYQSDQNTGFEFDHVAQQVPDIAEAVAWYLTLFPQAKVLYQDTSWAFVDVAGTKLAFVKKDQHPNHLAWRVSDAQLEQLAARYNQTIALHRDKTRSFYLEAPGKQWIEIICMDEATWAQSDKKDGATADKEHKSSA
jgi:hypothetical protein